MSTPKVMISNVELVSIDGLTLHPKNRNKHPQEQIERLARILEYQGFRYPVKVSKRSGFVTSGHGRIEAARLNGWTHVPVSYQDYESEEQEYADLIADNSIASWAELDLSGINADLGDLGPDFDLDLLGLRDFALDVSDRILDGNPLDRPKLADKFLAPPFSVLDARQGYWRTRKDQWLSMGIKSEIGRNGNLLGLSETVLQPDIKKRNLAAEYKELLKNNSTSGASLSAKIPGFFIKKNKGMTDEEIVEEFIMNSQIGSGTSIFDPVLCELVYRWFSSPNDTVVDPFAGGSVRGVVASATGRQYLGCELRQEQVDANRQQASTLCSDPSPAWVCGDSMLIDKHLSGVEADLIFSCPPYADLEVYSDDPKDLSNMPKEKFFECYREIIRKSIQMLKQDRFAVFVVGEVREKSSDGYYINFVQETIRAFEDAGAHHYNEIVLVTPLGTLPIRTSRMFSSSRKVGKTHQNVIVFCKGSAKKAAARLGEIEIPEDVYARDSSLAASDDLVI